ncbi:hypothetical protein ACIF83_43390 [Streptomyces sp. NPDC085866]|uniref:hypothetical protein n=1 Tax=Streptomyces sp. NPDC085866 TaxID=3365736 RepID=UPI0037D8B7B3
MSPENAPGIAAARLLGMGKDGVLGESHLYGESGTTKELWSVPAPEWLSGPGE